MTVRENIKNYYYFPF